MAATYADLEYRLVNGNKTVFNKKTGAGYPTPATLAADLGIALTGLTSSFWKGIPMAATPAPAPAPIAAPISTPSPFLTATTSPTPAPAPAPKVTPTPAPIVSVAPVSPKLSETDLHYEMINGNKTVVNTKTGTKYATPEQLAADLGKTTSGIKWDQIAPVPAAAPVASITTPTATPTPAPAVTIGKTAASGYVKGSDGVVYMPGEPLPPGVTAVPDTAPAAPGQPSGTSYTIQPGDTLSAIAAKNGTTVAALMAANPSITNPNLIYAGKSLIIPGTAAATPGSTDIANVTTVDEANQGINDGQAADVASQKAGQEPPVKTSFATLNDLINAALGKPTDTTTSQDLAALQGGLTPPGGPPAVPDTAKTYADLQAQYGITGLESQLTGLQAEQADLQAITKARVAAERGKPVATNIIEGRVSQVQQQQNERLASVTDQINSINNQLQTKYQVVNTLMNLKQTDYANAVNHYEKQMSDNIAMFNVLNSINEQAKNDVQKQQDTARSTLQIVYNAIIAGGADIKDMPADTKTLMTKLEVQAGLPTGFYQMLQSKAPKADVVSTTTWVDVNNNQYATVITKDQKTGEISKQNILLGKAKPTKAEQPTSEELKMAAKQEMGSVLQKLSKGGYITPAQWVVEQKLWVANTPYSAQDFNDAYRNYVDPSHPADYAGFEEYRPGFKGKITSTEAQLQAP